MVESLPTDPKKVANAIVAQILRDLTDRSGLGDEWDAIDSGIQKEIKNAWKAIIIRELSR